MKTYIVTGAAGHLGTAILHELKDKEIIIKAFLRNGESPTIVADNITYFYGDVCDISTLEPLFKDNEEAYVIHCAALISIVEKGNEEILNKVNVDGVANIISLCRKYKIKKLIHVSSVHALPDLEKGKIIEEIAYYDPDKVRGSYAKSKALGAQLVVEANDINRCILLPSGIVGPYDKGHNHLIQLCNDYHLGRLKVVTAGGYNFVDVRDVAEACIKAIARGENGQSYIISGHYLSIKEMLDICAAYWGQKKVKVIPTFLAYLGLPFIKLGSLITKKRPLYTSYSLYTLSANANFSNAKAIRELALQISDIKDTIEATCAYLDCEH